MGSGLRVRDRRSQERTELFFVRKGVSCSEELVVTGRGVHGVRGS